MTFALRRRGKAMLERPCGSVQRSTEAQARRSVLSIVVA
jgi:hypothetical protein